MGSENLLSSRIGAGFANASTKVLGKSEFAYATKIYAVEAALALRPKPTSGISVICVISGMALLLRHRRSKSHDVALARSRPLQCE